MLRTESNNTLIDAVEKLEVALQTPFVPGEMVSWAEAVRRSLMTVHSSLNEQINHVHHRTIKQIALEDPELSARAVNLKQADEQNMSNLEQLLNRAWNLPERVDQAEPDESSMESELREIIDDGLKFVLAVRGQETAIDTWMSESLNRDRGEGD